MTDPVIPPEAVEAAAKAYLGQIHEVNRTRILAEFEAVLAAALPHLRPLFEVATQVGLELGRQEAAEEVAEAAEEEADELDMPITLEWLELRDWFKDKLHEVAAKAREVATRTADARTDPPGHTDLPPTPDALSNRLPEDVP